MNLIKKLLVVLALATAIAGAQTTGRIPRTDTTNTWTGTNTFGVFNATGGGTLSGNYIGNPNFSAGLSANGPVALTGAGPGGAGNASGGSLNVQKPTSSASIFMGRFVDAHGDTNNQLLGLNCEQMVNWTIPINAQNSCISTELFTPIGNTQNITGTQVTTDSAFIHYGSGSLTQGVGVIGEAWNSGPSPTVTELDGVAGGCHNGSVSAGIPVQTPTGNGSVQNCRGVSSAVSNSSSGVITDAPSFFANACTNTGAGSIGTCYGIKTADQTVGGTNYSGFFGAGQFHVAGAADFSSTITMGASAGAGISLTVFPSNLTGASQVGISTLPVCSSAATTRCSGIQGQARTAAASFTVPRATAFSAINPNIGAGSVLAKSSGFDCDATGVLTGGTTNYCVDEGPNPERFQETTAPSGVASSAIIYADSTAHKLEINNNNGGFFPVAQAITATSAAFATATTAGTCVQNSTAVTGATTAMTVHVSPVSTPGVGAQWSAFVSSAGNITINECAIAASAGGTIAFNIRVTP